MQSMWFIGEPRGSKVPQRVVKQSNPAHLQKQPARSKLRAGWQARAWRRERAATKIAAAWRCHVARAAFKQHQARPLPPCSANHVLNRLQMD